MFIDTHCHLTFPEFQNDLSAVIERARDLGVERMIVPGINLADSREAILLCEKYSSLFAAVGVHPQESQQFLPSQLQEFSRLVKHPKVVAVGEIGLDYYRDYSPHELQVEVFKTFLHLAIESGLPVIIHNRSAFSDLVGVLEQKEFRMVSGVFHCFSEDARRANMVVKNGFLVSFTGTITFKNSRSAKTAGGVPSTKLLLETDAPFMAPVPMRGKRNEPAFLPYIAQKQAELHQESIEEIGRKTSELARQVFLKLQA